MIKEKFSEGDSFLHKLDPRVKITVALLFSVIVAVSDKYTSLIGALFFAIVAVILARLRTREVISRLLVVNSFIFLLWLMLPFTFPGKNIYILGSLNISQEGIKYALLITIKSNSIILVGIALLSTSSIFNLVHALRHLYLPDKLTQLFFFTYRYTQTIHSEYIRLNNALKIRGFKAQTNFHTYRTYAYLVGMMLVRSYDRSKRVYNAMLCRGFKGKLWTLNHFVFKKSDFVTGMVMISCIIGLVLLP
ncbi:MAG TPA: cobalt ECF transporter T component CbiQ [Candidatus Atribacteria bacterium]|nr:cobalt ECF transporter T component CbiQ [Candidatus Atribacteria bacterium]